MKNFIIALFLGFSAIASAQNTISGTVTNRKNEPVKGVSIVLKKANTTTTTNTEGKFTIENIANGNLKITFSIMGYISQNKTIIINQNTTIDIVLEDAVFEMDEVIVSTAFNKLQSQNVMKVEHESIKTLQRKGTSTLIEGLATIPGVAQVSTGTSIGKPVIRGLSGNRVLVYSQGVRIENQQFGDEHGLGLNDAGVESVEVVKGPASLLYGSDAIGGVIYLNPEKFADPDVFKSEFSQKLFSNTLGSNTSIGLKTSTKKWQFLTRGSYNTHSDYTIPGNNRVTNTRYNETDFKTGIGFHDAKFSSVLRYNYNALDLGIPENGIAEQSESKKTLYPKQGVFNHMISLNNNYYFKNSSLDFDLGYIFNDRSEYEDSDVAVLQMKLKTLNYNVKYHLPKLGMFETIFGIQGMHQTNKNSGEEYLIPDAVTNDFGIFGTTNYEWGKNTIQTGLRFDNRRVVSEAFGATEDPGSFEAIDKSYDSFNASIGYKTNLQENLTLRLNVASGFRAPTLAELTSNGVHEGTNRYEIGNSDLKTEQNIQTDLNLEYGNSHFEFFINGFYNHINNFIFVSPAGTVIDNNDVYNYEQENAALYGGEIGLHFHPHPLDWLHFESSFQSVTGKKDKGDYLPLIPANNWSNSLRTEFKIDDWLQNGFATLNVTSTFSQNNISDFETKTNDYTLLNLAIGGKIKWNKTIFELNLNANNLLNKTYTAHLSRLKTDGIPNIGRNIVLGCNFSI